MSKVELPHEGSGRNWLLCGQMGCTGETAPEYPLCVMHMPDAMRAEYLAVVAAGNKRLTLAGLTVSGRFFAAILAAMPMSTSNPTRQPRAVIPVDAFFDETVFTDPVEAQGVTFRKSCSMPKAEFQKGATWNDTQFFGVLDMRKARILGSEAAFSHARIDGEARCAGLESEQALNLFGVQFGQNLDLRYCKLNGIWLSNAHIAGNLNATHGSFLETPGNVAFSRARLDGVSVNGTVDFSDAKLAHETTFGGYSDMQPAQLTGEKISFRNCTFGDAKHEGRYLLQRLYLRDVDLSGCTFYGRVSFAQSIFTRRLVLSDVKVDDSYPHSQDQNREIFPEISLDLRQVSFEQGALIEKVNVIGTVEIECRLLQGDLDIEGLEAKAVRLSRMSVGYFPAEISAAEALAFTRCQFTQGGAITCLTSKLAFIECDARQPLTVASMVGRDPAKLTSFSGTNLESFVLSSIDMTDAIFTGAIGLDKLTIEGAPRFRRSPALIGTGRQVVQDEIILRARHNKRWRRLAVKGSDDLAVLTDYHRTAAVYRTLRKSREDNKDEPGAADFYYGEMEMRRLAAPAFSAERWLLTLYWLCSGYALRAWRAFVAFFVTLAAASLLLHQFGYTAHTVSSLSRSALLLTQISVIVATLPNTLTSAGTVTVIVARLLLVTFLALAVLALRGRVKR